MPASERVKPTGDRLVVKATERKEITAGGIYLPDTSKERPQEGVVVAVGPGRILDNGEHLTSDAQPGDHVIFPKYSGTEIKVDGEDLLILQERDILAIVS